MADLGPLSAPTDEQLAAGLRDALTTASNAEYELKLRGYTVRIEYIGSRDKTGPAYPHVTITQTKKIEL